MMLLQLVSAISLSPFLSLLHVVCTQFFSHLTNYPWCFLFVQRACKNRVHFSMNISSIIASSAKLRAAPSKHIAYKASTERAQRENKFGLFYVYEE